MSKLVFDPVGERYYETGVSQVVLYPQADGGTYPKGVAWNGVTAFNDKPSGAEPSPFYADNMKYLNIMSAEDYGAGIEAYYYPEEFKECDGSKEIAPGVYAGQQARKPFGLAVKTIHGNDTEGNDHSYKIHLVYGALAAPTERSYATVNESTEPMTMSWDLTTTPVAVASLKKPTAHLVIEKTAANADKIAALEAILYGSESEEARLPLPDEVITLMSTTQAAG